MLDLGKQMGRKTSAVSLRQHPLLHVATWQHQKMVASKNPGGLAVMHIRKAAQTNKCNDDHVQAQ
jgi:hypothetical protein